MLYMLPRVHSTAIITMPSGRFLGSADGDKVTCIGSCTVRLFWNKESIKICYVRALSECESVREYKQLRERESLGLGGKFYGKITGKVLSNQRM